MVGLRKYGCVYKESLWSFSCTGTVFLLGFLLKDYANTSYYQFDRINTVYLTHDGLAD
jgi:hypothetical protein